MSTIPLRHGTHLAMEARADALIFAAVKGLHHTKNDVRQLTQGHATPSGDRRTGLTQ